MLRATKRAITSIGACSEVLHLAKEDLEGGESFAVGNDAFRTNYLQMMQYARGVEGAFEVILIYIVD